MRSFFKWCWAALNNISTTDWLLGLGKTSLFGVLSGVFAWIADLPVLWTGLIAFAAAVLIWTAREISSTIKHLKEGALDVAREEFQAELRQQAARNRASLDGQLPKTTGLTDEQRARLKQAMKYGIVANQVGEELKRIHDEASAELKAEADFAKGFHKAEMRRTGSSDSARLLLAELWEEGVAIRNYPQTVARIFTPELDAWIERITKWMEEVIAALKPLDPATAIWFRTLGEVGPARVPIPNIQLEGKEDRARYIRAFCEHDLRLARLKELLPRYGVGI